MNGSYMCQKIVLIFDTEIHSASILTGQNPMKIFIQSSFITSTAHVRYRWTVEIILQKNSLHETNSSISRLFMTFHQIQWQRYLKLVKIIIYYNSCWYTNSNMSYIYKRKTCIVYNSLHLSYGLISMMTKEFNLVTYFLLKLWKVPQILKQINEIYCSRCSDRKCKL
jgi:hypothetical protein